MGAVDVCAGNIQSFWGGWEGSCFLAIAVSIMILAFLYMIGRTFKHPHLEAWVKDEFGQLFATVILVVMIVALMGFMCNFSPALLDPGNPRFYVNSNLGGPTKNVYDVAEGYLEDVRDRLVVAIGLTYTMNVFVDFVQSPTYEATPTGIGITTQTLAGLSPILHTLSTLLTALTVALITVVSQIAILQYAKVAMLGYFLPFGVFFRCFEPTRMFGGALIGLSIGLFLFYPFLLAFDDLIIHDSLVETQDASVASVQTFSDQNGNAVGTPIAVANLMGETIKNMFKAGFTFNQDRGGVAGIIETIFTPILGPIAVLIGFSFQLLIATVVLGVLNFVILITAIRGLSRLLGEEVDVTNITRMI
jgi:hypothetical protein